MERDPRKKTHKLGDNHNEFAVKRRKHTGRFSESRDIRESRGTRQSKLAGGRPCR